MTCQSQPALGCVYKLVEINGQPRIKLSQEVEKLVIPCRKDVFRLLGSNLLHFYSMITFQFSFSTLAIVPAFLLFAFLNILFVLLTSDENVC